MRGEGKHENHFRGEEFLRRLCAAADIWEAGRLIGNMLSKKTLLNIFYLILLSN